MRRVPQLYQIYGLYDPITGELRYVGETTMLLEHRLREHIYSARSLFTKDKNFHRRNWIRSLLKRGLEPEIHLLERLNTEEEMHERERAWIDYYLAKGADLTNSAGGGGGGFRAGSASAIAHGDKQAMTYLGFIDPDGNPIIITNMKRFCDAHGLTRKSMLEVYQGEKLSHKGYRHIATLGRARKNMRMWRGFIRPDGTPEPPFWNLDEFGQRYNLHKSRIYDLINGKCQSYKGWTYHHEEE